MYFDPATEAAIRTVWRELADSGVDDTQPAQGFRPHVSLAVAVAVDEEALVEVLASFAADVQPFDVTLGSVGMFGNEESGVVFYAPVVTQLLLTIHAEFHRRCTALSDDGTENGGQSYYLPGRWIPHVTLAQALGEARARRALTIATAGVSLPLHGRLVEIGLSTFTPSVMRHLFELGGGRVEWKAEELTPKHDP